MNIFKRMKQRKLARQRVSLRRKLLKAVGDPDVDAIVLHVESPGGQIKPEHKPDLLSGMGYESPIDNPEGSGRVVMPKRPAFSVRRFLRHWGVILWNAAFLAIILVRIGWSQQPFVQAMIVSCIGLYVLLVFLRVRWVRREVQREAEWQRLGYVMSCVTGPPTDTIPQPDGTYKHVWRTNREP